MFTGIVTGKAFIQDVQSEADILRVRAKFPEGALAGISIGASVALNGVCLTVTQFAGDEASFDLVQETTRVTTLGELKTGEWVNFERAAKFSDEVGGHIVSGHISCTAQVIAVDIHDHSRTLTFQTEKKWMKYIHPKGYIAVNGASLTLGEKVGDNTFQVHLIPETLAITTFGTLSSSSKVNIEFDSQTQVIVDTVQRILPTMLSTRYNG